MSEWNDFFAPPEGNDVTSVVGVTGFKGAMLKLAADHNLPTGMEDPIDFDTVVYDEGTWFSGGSPGELTVPVGVTKIRAAFGLNFQPGTTGTRFAALYIDRGSGFGRVEAGLPDWRISPTSADGSQEMSAVSSVIEVSEGDKFRVQGFSSQASQHIETSGDGASYFSIEAVEAIASIPITPRGALVKRTGTFALANNSEVALPFDDEEYDTDDIHDNSVNNTRLTVPADVTHVRLYGFMSVSSDTSGYRSLRISKNGGDFVGKGHTDVSAASRNTQEITVNSAIVEVVAGNYFELMGFQNAGETRNVTPYFSMEIVQPAVLTGNFLTDIVDDTTPQLGGNLDSNGFKITVDGSVVLSFASSGEEAENWVDIEHSQTGSGPIIRSVGADTNVDLNIEAKGTGAIVFASPLALGPAPLIALDTVIDGGFTIPAIAAGPPSFVDVAFGTAAPTAAIGDSVILGFLGPPPPGLMFNAFVIGPTAIVVRIADVTGAGFPGGPLALKATVMSF